MLKITKKTVKTPFNQINLLSLYVRFFTHKDKDNFVWHFDENDRIVFYVSLGSWSFQNDNKLPFKLKTFGTLKINKKEYHRIINNNKGILITIIKEK